jgi:integrase
LDKWRDEARSVVFDVKHGVDRRAGAIKKAVEASIAGQTKHLVEKFIELHVMVKTDRRRQMEVLRLIRTEILPRFGDAPFAALRLATVNDALGEITARGALEVANRVAQVLKQIGRWGVTQGRLETNPLRELKQPNKRGKRTRVLLERELVLIWNAAGVVGGKHGALVRLLILTAQRRGEIGGLLWSELDFEAKQANIQARRMKSRRPHSWPLSASVLEILAEQPRVAGSNKALGVVAFSRVKGQIDKALDGAIVEPWTLHDIRRSARTLWQKLHPTPIQFDVAESLLDHVLPGISGVYARATFDDEKRDAMGRWADRVAVLTTPNVISLKRVAT